MPRSRASVKNSAQIAPACYKLHKPTYATVCATAGGGGGRSVAWAGVPQPNTIPPAKCLCLLSLHVWFPARSPLPGHHIAGLVVAPRHATSPQHRPCGVLCSGVHKPAPCVTCVPCPELALTFPHFTLVH